MKVSVVLAGLAASVSATSQGWSTSGASDPNATPTSSVVTTAAWSPSTPGNVAAAATKPTPATTPAANGTNWGTWNSTGSPANVASAAASSCPPWTLGTAAPAYLTNLPSSIQAALPTWSGTPPSDWCSNTAWMAAYASCTSNSTSAVAAATNTAAPSNGTVSPANTGAQNYTGAGNANGGSFAVAGLAAAAVLVMV